MFWLLMNATRPGHGPLEAGHRARIVQLVRRAAAATRGQAIFGWLDAERHAHHMPVSLRLPVSTTKLSRAQILHYFFLKLPILLTHKAVSL